MRFDTGGCGARYDDWRVDLLSPRIGNVCDTHVQLLVPADGDYEFVTAAGVLFGAYGRVSVHGPF